MTLEKLYTIKRVLFEWTIIEVSFWAIQLDLASQHLCREFLSPVCTRGFLSLGVHSKGLVQESGVVFLRGSWGFSYKCSMLLDLFFSPSAWFFKMSLYKTCFKSQALHTSVPFELQEIWGTLRSLRHVLIVIII